MEKVDAARRAEGFIELEIESAEQVKRAVEQVSRITASKDNGIKFEGRRIIEGHGFGRLVNCYDVYQTPQGYLLHTYMNKGPNWAVAGKTLDEMLAAAPDQAVARRAHGELIKKNLLPIKH